MNYRTSIISRCTSTAKQMFQVSMIAIVSMVFTCIWYDVININNYQWNLINIYNNTNHNFGMEKSLSQKMNHTNKFDDILDTKFIIFVPYCDVYENFIIECLESIEKQNYYRMETVIVNDGGHRITHIIDFIENKANYKIISFEENNGPAFSKWKFIEYIQTHINNYNYNDIVIILDGDDMLNNVNALQIISSHYNENKCWVTYGNAFEKFHSSQTVGIPDEWVNIRKEEWIYPHPRSFKLFLTLFFEKNDFQMNNSWLTKGTDRPLIYNILEWSGKKRSKNIRTKLYVYREHDHNSYKTISYISKMVQLNYMTSLQPKSEIIEDIHIVMCTFSRISNILAQINSLNDQTVANRIQFHIINNNKDDRDELHKIIVEVNKTSIINIFLTHYNNKYNVFQRFIYIGYVLLKKYICDYVLIIDDDQILPFDWVENMYDLRSPRTFMPWYGKVWTNNNSLNYWNDSIINHADCLHNNKKKIVYFDYGGSGGAIIDASIFNENSKLWDTPTDLPHEVTVYNIDDLWLSFVINHYYNWTIKRSFLPIREIKDENTTKTALWPSLIKQKQQFLEYLVYKREWLIF